MPVEEFEENGVTRFKAQCLRCGTFEVVKDNRISAERALSGHAKSCKGVTGGEGVEAEEEAVLLSPQQQLMAAVKTELMEQLPKVAGIGGKTKEGVPSKLLGAITSTLTPEIISAPQNLINHILSIAKRANAYNVWLVTNAIFARLQEEGLYMGSLAVGPPQQQAWGMTPGYAPQQGLTEERARALFTQILSERDKDNEIKELRREVEALKKGEGSSGSTDAKTRELEIYKLKREIADEILSKVPQPTVGKTTIDFLSELGDKADRRASEIIERLGQPGFKPVAKRSSRERKTKAEEIEKRLIKRQEILDAEDQLILAARGMFRSGPAKGVKA